MMMNEALKNTMNAFFDNFCALVTNDVLTPIANYLRTNKGIDVSVQELQGAIQIKVTPMPQPTVSTMPTAFGGLPVNRSTLSFPTASVSTNGCKYTSTRCKDPSKQCGKPTIEGTEYCKACWAKKTVQKEAAQLGIQIPQVVLEAEAKKEAKKAAASTTMTVPSTALPGVRPPVNNLPKLPLTNPVFGQTMGKVTLPQAPVQSLNPFQAAQTSNMSFLDERMERLGMNISEYGDVSRYLIAPNNIVYTYEGEDNNPQPKSYVGVLDVETKTFRTLYDNEKTLALPNTTYDPSALPTKTVTAPTQPTVPLATGFKPIVPLKLGASLPPFMQPKIPTATVPLPSSSSQDVSEDNEE